MILLYDIGVWLYQIGIRLAAVFGNEKARLWLSGRRDIFKQIGNALPKTKDPSRKTIWMHVASLGEFEQGRPIIEALKSAQYPNIPISIILTFFSPSGFELRKNYPLADHIFYLPMDSRRNARRFLDLIKPDVAVFVKYEFWLHYLTELHRRDVPTLLVSAIFRAKQFVWLNPYTVVFKKILHTFTHIFTQDTPSVILLQNNDFQHITRVGDTRIDRVAAIAEEARRLPEIEAFVGDAPVFIGGSTWDADEKIIMPILSKTAFQSWKFIFAPHDISEKNIARLERLLPEPSVRFSKYAASHEPQAASDKPQPNTKHQTLKTNPRILIMDNVGMLSALYRYGRVAYIGGGFGRGIHNTLEPIAFGLPVIFGVKYQKFAEAVALVASGGGFSVADTVDEGNPVPQGGIGKGFQKCMFWLLEKENYDQSAAAARLYVAENRGATQAVVAFINKLFDN